MKDARRETVCVMEMTRWAPDVPFGLDLEVVTRFTGDDVDGVKKRGGK